MIALIARDSDFPLTLISVGLKPPVVNTISDLPVLLGRGSSSGMVMVKTLSLTCVFILFLRFLPAVIG